jgi:glycerol dehydrogenase
MTDTSHLTILAAPSRYVQGPGAIDALGEMVRVLGGSAVVLADELVWSIVADRVTQSLASAGVAFRHVPFSGECTDGQIQDGVTAAQELSATVVVGIGGGKAADTAKSVGASHGARWACVVTSASSDGPASSASVIYSETGEVVRYDFHGKNPDLVLVDSEIVAKAPSRLLASGMGDAVSTRWEARAAAAKLTPTVAGGRPSAAALALAELAWVNCRDHGDAALDSVDRGVVTPALELIIETNTVHSCIGFESGGFSGAHSIHNGLSELPELHGALHGEKVSFGVVAQLVLEEAPVAELEEYAAFSDRMGLPLTLAELGLASATLDQVQRAADVATGGGESIHWMPRPVTAADVAAAIAVADQFGIRWRANHTRREF